MSISDNRPDDLAGHQTSEVELSRRAYRKRQQLKSVITSLISTIVLAAIIVVGLEMSPDGRGSRRRSSPLNTSQHHCLRYWLACG